MQKKGNVYALLAAVNQYDAIGHTNLTTGKMDLELMQLGLVGGLKIPEEHIRVLDWKESVTRSMLARAMADFRYLLQGEDTFIFYFSGHGDGTNILFSDGALQLQSLIDFIEELPAKNKIIILDCCYAGKAKNTSTRVLQMEDSLESFVGHGTAILASSAADEVARLGPGNNHSLFTGIISTAFMKKALVRKGKIYLLDIENFVRNTFSVWNQKCPQRSQQPVFRGNVGGTIFFVIDEAPLRQPELWNLQMENCVIREVRPLSSQSQKRLCAFIIPKGNGSLEELPDLTQEVAEKIRYEDVFSTQQSRDQFQGQSAEAIWCYFGHEESDMIRSNYYAFTIWAKNETVLHSYYKEDRQYMKIIDGIGVCDNSRAYTQIKKLEKDAISAQAYRQESREILTQIVTLAERYIGSFRELENKTITLKEMQEEYISWNKEIYHLYHRLTNEPLEPVAYHDWTDELISLAGWVWDLGGLLTREKEQNELSSRNRWLINDRIQRYYKSLEKLKSMEADLYQEE